MNPLKVLLASSEVAPFAKTGGLADVSSALARFLVREGHDARVVMPLYARVREAAPDRRPVDGMQDLSLQLGQRELSYSVEVASLPESHAPVYFVRCADLYDRADIYSSEDDEPLRFAFLSRVCFEMCQRWQWAPDVLHCNDWHTALAPLYLRTLYAWDALFERTKTVLTIHNIGYQGTFETSVIDEIGLGEQRDHFYREDLEDGVVNFLKTGVLYADVLTTVSETYAREIQGAELGMGLESLLSARSDTLFGIVNGVDYGEWSPESDTLIPHAFSAGDLAGKAKNKRALLEQLGLEYEARTPVLGVVSRLTPQKGFELLPDILPVFLQRMDLRVVVLGSGEEKYERYFEWLRETFPTKVGFYRGFNNELAHLIEAGSDIFLMPSRYEPCGLNQMYSLRYGTIPIVRKTGGLADTVQPFDRGSGEGTGFLFEDFNSEALMGALRQALEVYRDEVAWARLMQNAMACDYSWDRQGQHYIQLYQMLRQE